MDLEGVLDMIGQLPEGSLRLLFGLFLVAFGLLSFLGEPMAAIKNLRQGDVLPGGASPQLEASI